MFRKMWAFFAGAAFVAGGTFVALMLLQQEPP